jgi:hypothetical protein
LTKPSKFKKPTPNNGKVTLTQAAVAAVIAAIVVILRIQIPAAAQDDEDTLNIVSIIGNLRKRLS